MGFSIVSDRILLREMVATYCACEGFEVQGLFSKLAEIPDGWPGLDVILFVSEVCDIDEFGITEFQSRFQSARIILLISSSAPEEVIKALTPRVEALIMDDRSLHTLTGFLTVVQEGFNISPAGGPVPQTRHTASVAGTTASRALPPSETAVGSVSSGGRGWQKPTGDVESPPCLAKLSPREREVLCRLRDGQSNKDIAKNLDIVESTVKVHLRGCFRKIGAQNRTQAAVWAAQFLPD